MNRDVDLMAEVQAFARDASGTTRSIAEFLLLEGSGLANMSMEQVAHATYTSKASLVRFARHLGFDGWVSFKSAFVEATSEYEVGRYRPGFIDVNFPFAVGDAPAEAVRKVMQAKELGVRRALRHLSNKTLHEAAQMIMKAPVFGVFGKEPGRSLGTAFCYNMRLIGRRCIVPHTEESEFVMQGFGQGDCALFISYTGRVMGEPTTFVEEMRSRGVKIVSITKIDGPLARLSDIALTFDGEEHYFNKVGGFYSCSAIECLLDALYVACYLEHYEDNLTERARYTKDLATRYSVPDSWA